MGLTRLVGHALTSAAILAGLGIAVLLMMLAGFGFLTVALYIFLSHHLGAAAAAAITAAALLGGALFILLAGLVLSHRRRRRAPKLFADTASTIATITGIAQLLVRNGPRRAILFSLVAGALTEYFAGPE
jgi:hypothetical protein